MSGYDNAAKIAKKAHAEGKDLETGGRGAWNFKSRNVKISIALVKPEEMTHPGD